MNKPNLSSFSLSRSHVSTPVSVMQPSRLKYHLRPLEHLWANYRDNRIATACAKNHSFFSYCTAYGPLRSSSLSPFHVRSSTMQLSLQVWHTSYIEDGQGCVGMLHFAIALLLFANDVLQDRVHHSSCHTICSQLRGCNDVGARSLIAPRTAKSGSIAG